MMPSASFGYRPPAWHTALAPGSRASDPKVLARCAAAAGFTRVQAHTMAVPTGLATPAELVSWRLGMAHVAPFMRSLDAPGRAAVRRAAEQAVAAAAGGRCRWSSPWWCSPPAEEGTAERAQSTAARRASRRSASRSSPSA